MVKLVLFNFDFKCTYIKIIWVTNHVFVDDICFFFYLYTISL